MSSLRLADAKQDEKMQFDKLALKPKKSIIWKLIVSRIFAVLCSIWTLIVLVTETTLIYRKESTIVYWFVTRPESGTLSIFIFTILFLSGLTFNCFFTIFNLKISDHQ